MSDETHKDPIAKTAALIPDEQLDGASGGKTPTTTGKTSSLQVGPAPAKPVDSGSLSTTQI